MPSNNVTADITALEKSVHEAKCDIRDLQAMTDRWRGTDGPEAARTRQQEAADQQLRMQCASLANGCIEGPSGSTAS